MAEKSLNIRDTESRSVTRMGNPRKIIPTSGAKTVAANGTAERLYPLPITVVDQGNKKFTIAGDQVGFFGEGDTIDIEGSTGNDGEYTVVSATLIAGPNTEIVVSEAIPDATADGDMVIDLPARLIVIQAKSGNTGSIWLGSSNVDDTNGEELTAGETTILDIDIISRLDVNNHFIDADVNGEGVNFRWYWKW